MRYLEWSESWSRIGCLRLRGERMVMTTEFQFYRMKS